MSAVSNNQQLKTWIKERLKERVWKIFRQYMYFDTYNKQPKALRFQGDRINTNLMLLGPNSEMIFK